MGSFQGKSLPKRFIDMSEINENFDEENVDVPAEGTGEEAPVEDAPVDGESTEGTEGAEGTEEGQPEVIKVYTDSEEDIQELVDAGILEEDGTLPEDGLYIKIKTIDGEEATLLFTEKDPSARTPVTDEDLDTDSNPEGEEGMDDAQAADVIEDQVTESEEFEGTEDDIDADAGTEDAGTEGVEGEEGADTSAPGRYDTELCAQHNDHEYCVAAEIEISETGEIEDVDPKEDEETGEPEVQATEATEGEEGTDDFSAGLPEETDEDRVTESRIWDFSTFVKKRK